MSERSLGVLKGKEGAAYLALNFPALIIQSTYSIAMYNAEKLGASRPLSLAVQLVGLAALISMVVSVVTFRPTSTIFSLGISFFIVALLPRAPTPDPLVFISALILLLLSFNFGRSVRMTAGRTPEVYSRGPIHFRALSLSLNGILPIAASIGLVVLASIILETVKSGVTSLPYPLSDLILLYLDTRIGFVSFILLNAGILLWIIREFLEPAVLYYSLDQGMAGRFATERYEELKRDLERKFLKHRLGIPLKPAKPSRVTLTLGLILLILILVLYGPTPQDIQVKSEGLLERIPLGLDGKTIIQSFSKLIEFVDSKTLSLENLIRYLIRILWGG